MRAADGVPELVAFRLEVVAVVVVRLDLDRLLRDGGQPEAADPGDLPRVVREHADRRQPEVGEDLRPDPVLARVGLEAELEVRLDGVEPLLLELVRAQLVEQADAPALLGEVEQDALALCLDPGERALELLAAVAAPRVEDVPGQALRVDADEDVLLPLDVPLHERDVLLPGQRLAVGDRLELAVLGRQVDGHDALDELLGPPPVLDQVGDGDELQPVPRAELDEVRRRGPSSRRRS